MSAKITISGGADIARKLQAVGVSMERAQEIILRAAGRVIADAAADNVRGDSSTTAQNIEVDRVRGDGVVIGIGPTRKAWFSRFIEHGTRPHEILAKRKTLRFEQGGDIVYSRRVIVHPGTRARPFMGPAVNDTKDAAMDAAASKAEQILKSAT